MRAILLAAAMTASFALAAGCGGESKDNKGPAGKPTAQPGGNGGETARPDTKTKTPPGPTTPDKPETPATAAGDPSWLKYVTDDFFAAVVVKPRKIIDSPVLKGLPMEMVTDQVKRQSPIDPAMLEEVVVLGRAPAPGAAPSDMPIPGVIVKLPRGTDVKALIENTFGKSEEDVLDGKKLHKSPDGDGAILELGEGWILLSDPDMVKKMAAGTGGKSPLAGRLKAADPAAELFAVALVEPVRKLAQQTAEMAKSDEGIPKPLANAAGAADHLSAATITLSLAGQQPLSVVLEGKNDESAGKLEEMAQGLLLLAKAGYAGLRGDLAEKPDAEAIKPVLSLVDDVLGGIQIAKEGANVKVALKRTKGMDDLAAVLAPAIAKAQEAAGRMERMNNLKQIGLAMHNYASVHQALPAAAIQDKDGKPLLSWRVAILPFLEHEGLYEQFKLDEPWDSEHNKKVAETMPKIYQVAGAKPGTTSIVVFTGEGTPFGGKKGPTFADMKDGMSNTIMCVEAGPDKAVPWTKPEDVTFDKEAPVAALGNLAEGQFLAAFCDGSVRTLKKAIDPETLRRLIQHDDGQEVDRSKF